MARRGLAAASVLVLSLMAAVARAESNPFGAPGQRVPFGEIGVELEFGAGAPGTGDAIVLAPHFFVGLGPYVRALYGSGQVTPREDDWSVAVGLNTMFGTWL